MTGAWNWVVTAWLLSLAMVVTVHGVLSLIVATGTPQRLARLRFPFRCPASPAPRIQPQPCGALVTVKGSLWRIQFLKKMVSQFRRSARSKVQAMSFVPANGGDPAKYVVVMFVAFRGRNHKEYDMHRGAID